MPKIRNTAEQISSNRRGGTRRDKSTCPFCSSRLKRKTQTSRLKSCEVCKAQKDKFPDANCCSKPNIWRQGHDYRCFTCGKDIVPPVMDATNKNWKPMENESAQEYVERVGGWCDPDNSLVLKIEHYYKVDRGESRKLLLSSRSFWEKLFNDNTKGIFERGGSRYGALRYIQRKNDFLRGGRKIFSQLEIDEIVDSVGKWKR